MLGKMNTKFDDSFVEKLLCPNIKQEINLDEVEDNRCLYMRDVMLEDDQTSDDKIDPPANDLFKNEILVCPEVKHEIEETLFVSVVKTEDGLTSEHDGDKSYLLPEKEDPLDIGCSGSSSSNGVITKIELHKVEEFDIKCEEGVFDDERVSEAPENIDFTLSTGKCVTQNINKDNCLQDNGIEYDDDLQSLSFKETISTMEGGVKREHHNVYVNSSLNNSNEYSCLQDDMFHCYDCGEVYVAKSKISNHLCKGVRKFYCIVCNDSSVSEETLKIHSCVLNKKNDVMNGDIDKKSQLENFIENNSINTVINKIIQHKRHNNDCGKYKCKFCEKVFKCKRTLIFHMEKSSHKCTFRQKSFNQKGTLKRHLNTHTVEKKYKCNFCEKAFKGRGNLRRHIFVHTGEEKFTCDFCQKSVRKSYFMKHISIHTSGKKFTCDFCQKSFNRRYNLKKHVSIHTGKKNFKCSFCERGFSQNSHLKRHLFIHYGEKKFTCHLCEKSFYQNSDLKRHISMHTGEKKFTCKFCEKSFSWGSSLKAHLVVHAGKKN